MKPWEANIRKVVPYTPGEQPNERGMIKLNTNENPYSPAPGVEKALKALDADTLRLIRIRQQETWYTVLPRSTAEGRAGIYRRWFR